FWAIKGESYSEQRPGRRGTRAQTTVLEERPRWIASEYLSEGDWLHTPAPHGEDSKNHDLMWVYGLFAAEGHTIVDRGASKRHNRIEFTMHIDEESVLQRAKSILDVALEREGRIWTRPKRNTCQLSYSGRDVAVRFRDLFGHGAHNKRVPVWMYDMDAP